MGKEVRAHPVAQLRQALEIALILGEVVIQRRQFLLVDFLDVRAPFDGFARELLLLIVRAVGSDFAIFLPHLGADQHLVDAVGEALLRDLQQPVLALGFRERLAILEALDGHDGDVALLDHVAALDFFEAGLTLAEPLDSVVDILIGDRDGLFRDLQALVVLEHDLGFEIEDGAELERGGEIGFFVDDLGLDDGLEVMFLERLVGVFLDEFLDDLAADLITEKFLQQIARSVAGAKALEHHAATQFVVGFIEFPFNFVGLDLDGEFAPERGVFFDVDVHVSKALTAKHTPDAWINATPHYAAGGALAKTIRRCSSFIQHNHWGRITITEFAPPNSRGRRAHRLWKNKSSREGPVTSHLMIAVRRVLRLADI